MNFKKAVCFSLILVIIAGLFLRARPAQAISDTDLYLKNNAKVTISPDTYKIPCPIKKVEDLRYSGKWDVIVDGSDEGQSTAIKNLVKTGPGKGKADQYNFVQYGKIGQWASVLNGDKSFVNSNASNFRVNISGSSRIYLGYLAELCGGYVAKYRAYGDEGETGKIWLGTTPKPKGQISVPSFAKEGESVKIRLSGQTFSNMDRDIAKAIGVDSKQTIITFNVDGKSVIDGKSISSNSYSETITQRFTSGTHTLTLFVKDNVNRYTREDVTIEVGVAPPPPPPPGTINANIVMKLSPNSIKKGTKEDVRVSLDASRSRSSGSGPFHYRWWIKKNGKYITSKDGAKTETPNYSMIETRVSPGDVFWAKVKVYDFSINKADEAETERMIYEEGEDPPDPEPEPDPPPPPIPVPPIARFDMPEEMPVSKRVKIVNRSKNKNGFTQYDGKWLNSEWQISPSENIDKELGQAGGKAWFNMPGTYTVTLTVTDNKGMSDTTSKQIKITNKPPIARIQAPDEVIQGTEVDIFSDCVDPDDNLDLDSFQWDITPKDGLDGKFGLHEGSFIFDKPGVYEVTLTVKDTCGLTDTAKKTIRVLPVIPEAYFTFEGSQKQNRKLVFDSSGSSSAERYPVDWSKNEWQFIPETEGVTADNIKIVESEDVKTRTVMFKKPGDYKVRLRVTNEAGNASEWFEQLLRIYEDEPPIADFYVQSTVLRDPVNSNKAKIELINSSYSPDGDIISERVWRYKYDSNNDGNFDDEVWHVLDSGNNTNPVLYTDQVGKYLFELYVKEEFGEETIPEFLTPEDVRDADTDGKPIEDKKCEVVNLQPVVDFEAINKPKVDLVVKGVTNSSWASRFNSEANNLVNNISAKGFNVKRDVKLEQKSTGTRYTQKASIYFNTSRGPYYPDYTTSNGFDYTTGIGDFGWTLRYSSDFSSASIFVEMLDRNVSESRTTPRRYPQISYSVNGSTWKTLSVSYTGSYTDWRYLEEGVPWNECEFFGRAFRFNSSSIHENVRYIKVRDSEGRNSSEQVIYVSATAYGYENYPVYVNLNDDKFTQELKRSWQEDSSKYVVLVSDCGNSISKVYDIVNDYILKGIKVVFVGTSGLRTVGNQIAEGTGGTFIEFDGRNVPWDRIEEYLTDELQKQKTITQTILVGEEVEYKIYYNDPENDPKYQERWLYTHDHKYYENSLGLASFSDKYIDTAVTRFDKVGKYEVTYQARDNPKDDNKFDEYRLWSYMPLSKLEIYVHRKPIAQFTATIKPNGSKFDITISSTSYDLDHYSETSRGIIEEEWKWKDYNSTTWNSGKPNSIDSNKKILVSLRVKDKEGVWSDPYIKVLSTAAENLPPIAQFTATPSTQIENKSITIADQSYDPNGDPIAEWRWRVKKPNGSWVNYRGRMPTDITKLGVGIYTIELKVRDKPRVGSSLWSEPYTQTVKVIADNNKPVARFTMGPNPIIADEGYILNDTSYDPDGDPIVAREWKIQRPNGTWVNIPELKPTFEEMGIDDDGTYRIGLRVLDDPTRRNPILSPYWSDWYYQTVTVESPLNVIGDSDKDVYRAGQAMLLTAETEGKAYKVEAKMWYPKNEFTNSNKTTLKADRTLTDPPQKIMTWRTRRTKEEGRDIVVIIPLNTPDGEYPIKFTAYKKKMDGGVKKAEHTIKVKVRGTVYDHSHSEIIGPIK